MWRGRMGGTFWSGETFVRPEGEREGEGREEEGEKEERERKGEGGKKRGRGRERFMKAMISQLVFTVFSPRR